jgi:hypothetical protein
VEPAVFIFRVEEYSSALKMEAAGFSEKIVSLYETAWCHIPEDHGLNYMSMFKWNMELEACKK